MIERYRIESDIPLPSGVRRARRYPFKDMKIGDSFLVKDRKAASVMSAVRRFMRQEGNGRAFTTRNVDGGVRCWRTA